MTAAFGASVVLSPPTPPAAPHLGTAYTWALSDALARASAYLGSASTLPQSWNMSSRRIEDRFGADPTAYAAYCQTSVSDALAAQQALGVEVSPQAALRDDSPKIRQIVQRHLLDLVDAGAVREITAEEKWCHACEIATPPTSANEHCHACGAELRLDRSIGWFLELDLPTVMGRAERIRWMPAYALNRLQNLTDVHPYIRVSHRRRGLGVPSPLASDSILDPRLVGAMWPSVLRHLGLTEPPTVVAGLDIQRKWLLTMLATNPEAIPKAVVNHGTLLDEHGSKMSRYAGATLEDSPDDVDQRVLRAALLSIPLGKDVRADRLPLAGASRLHHKLLNCLRFLALITDDAHGIDLEQELRTSFKRVEEHLAAHDVPRAMEAFRRLVVHDLSGVLIPRVRTSGGTGLDKTRIRLSSLHQVFYGSMPSSTTGKPNGAHGGCG